MESHICSCNYEPAHTLQVCNFQTLVIICTADYIYDLANLFISQTGRNSKLTLNTLAARLTKYAIFFSLCRYDLKLFFSFVDNVCTTLQVWRLQKFDVCSHGSPI
jgi:hypothetical protein